MFYFPNDTTLAPCGLATFENTLAIWDIYFCPKSQIPFLYRIIATTSGLNNKWYSAYVPASQRNHPRLMWTCQLREHPRHLRHVFLPKSQIPFLYRMIATNSGLNIKWCSAYVLPSQRRHPRLMWTWQLREHSCHLRHTFLPKSQILLLHTIYTTISGLNIIWHSAYVLLSQLASFENTLAVWDIFLAQNHKFHFCTGQMRQLQALILNGTPLMFCFPNLPALRALSPFKTCFAQNHKFNFCTG